MTKTTSRRRSKPTRQLQLPATKRIGKSADRPPAEAGANSIELPAKTKTLRCLDLLTRRNGASIAELMVATNWQAHSVRGFLSGTVRKKLGLNLDVTTGADGIRRYRTPTARGAG